MLRVMGVAWSGTHKIAEEKAQNGEQRLAHNVA